MTVAPRRGQARPMSLETTPGKKKLPIAKLVIGAVVLAGGAFLILRGFDVRGWIEHGIEAIRDAGPVAYFSAMALAPALGVPGLAFTLTAGPAFGDRFGMPLVVALSLAALTVNFVFTYFLARRALRPLLENIMTRLGYALPDVDQDETTDLAIVVRVTPGIPFFVQNYLLGLARVPFGRYLIVSCIVVWIYSAGFVLFGDALLHGKGKMATLAASLLIVAVAGTNWARKHYAKKKRQATDDKTGGPA